MDVHSFKEMCPTTKILNGTRSTKSLTNLKLTALTVFAADAAGKIPFGLDSIDFEQKKSYETHIIQ